MLAFLLMPRHVLQTALTGVSVKGDDGMLVIHHPVCASLSHMKHLGGQVTKLL